jgi:hypothetical protein
MLMIMRRGCAAFFKMGFVVAFLAVTTMPSPSAAEADKPLLAGWIEQVSLDPGNIVLDAKLDTGAEACSLHAPDVKEFLREGQKWVRFHIKDAEGRQRAIERPVVGTKKVPRHFGAFQRRFVIPLEVCLAGIRKDMKVNIVDRTGFEYQMLIGRDFMEGDIAVNPSVKYTTAPSCPTKEADRGPIRKE